MRKEKASSVKNRKEPASPRKLLLSIVLAGLMFGLLGLGEPIDLLAHIGRSILNQRAATDNIVIVKIDDASLHSVGNWPWSRRTQATLVNELSRLGARQIVYDVVFAYATDAKSDALFADALRRSGRVTLGISRQSKSGEAEILPAFSAHTRLADITLKYSWDGRVHDIFYASDKDGVRTPGISTALAGWKVPPSGTYPLDASIDPKTFLSVSAGDVINGRIDAKLISGKVALIGTTTDMLGDQFMLPRYGRIGGVYIHALGGETLIRGRPLALGWVPALLIACLVCAIAITRRRAITQNLLLLLCAAVLLVVPTPFEADLTFFDVGPALLMMAVLAWHLNWSRMRQRSTVNDVSGLPNLVALRADPAARDRPLVVARLHNYAEIVSALPADSERQFVEQVTGRLCVGAPGRKLFHGDEGLFAWFAEPGIPLGHHLEALHALFRSPVKVRGSQYDVMISFGVDIGSGRAAANRLGSALVAADEAEAESLKWKYHDPARLADASWKLSLLSQLDDAIENGEVWVAYQPKLDLGTGRIIGVEALARWTHPEKGPISPTEFIGAAEQHDRIERLTDYILDQAVSAAASGVRQGRPLSLAVNLSARLLNDANLPRRVSDCLTRHGLSPDLLTLELTETAALAGTGQDIEMLGRLRDLGVKISIDDYGTGLSTLDYLKKVPASEIKIDQSFIKSLRDHRSDRVMVQSTIALAHSLGRVVVAEGVEDRETLELLTSMGCDVAQGFIIGRPTSFRSVIKRLNGDRGLRVA
ncbi:MAG: EAL domain-containing protein [Sphingomicrobium sp.]